MSPTPGPDTAPDAPEPAQADTDAREELRDRIANAIRAAAHYCEYGCDCDGAPVWATLATGGSISGVEAAPDALADAVLPVVEAATAAKDAEIERLRGLLALAEAAAPATNALAKRQRERAEAAERERDGARAELEKAVQGAALAINLVGCQAAEDRTRTEQAEALLRDLIDPDDCYFDHHGGCQAHGYLSLQPGEKCPHAEAKELLAALDQPKETE